MSKVMRRKMVSHSDHDPRSFTYSPSVVVKFFGPLCSWTRNVSATVKIARGINGQDGFEVRLDTATCCEKELEAGASSAAPSEVALACRRQRWLGKRSMGRAQQLRVGSLVPLSASAIESLSSSAACSRPSLTTGKPG